MEDREVELTRDGACALRAGGVERWRVALDLGEAAWWNPFRAAITWSGAQRVIAAARDRVHVLHATTGALDRTFELAPDCFGHLAVVAVPQGQATVELLLVLGWTDIWAHDADLSLRWHARHVAVDGITFDRVDGSVLRVHAEMDPPGGWFAVSLDVATGREHARHPSFLPGYVGIYGEGPDG